MKKLLLMTVASLVLVGCQESEPQTTSPSHSSEEATPSHSSVSSLSSEETTSQETQDKDPSLALPPEGEELNMDQFNGLYESDDGFQLVIFDDYYALSSQAGTVENKQAQEMTIEGDTLYADFGDRQETIRYFEENGKQKVEYKPAGETSSIFTKISNETDFIGQEKE